MVRDLFASPLVAATLVTIAFFLVTVIGLTRSGEERAIAEEKLLLETFALSLSEHIEQAMKRGDDLLKQVRHAYLKDPRRIKDLLEMHNQVLSREVFPLEAVMDANGMMVASNADTTIPTPRVDLSDREHFRVHKEAADPSVDKLFVSKVLVGRVSKKAVMQLTRAIRSTSGEFLGVVVVSISPDEFIEPYRHMGGSDSVISIVGFDRIGRIRVSHDKTEYSVDYTKSEAVTEMLKTSSGIVETTSSADGVRRLYAFRHIEGTPLLVSVGSSTDEIHSAFRSAYFGNLPTVGIMVGVSLVALLALAVWSHLLNRRLQQSNDALADNMRDMAMANTAQKQFVASVSHELRTPLHGILGHAQMLALDAPSGPLHESAQAIFKSATDLRSIVNQLLDMARVEAGKEVLYPEPVRIARLIDEVCLLHRAAAEHSGLSFRVDSAAVNNLTIISDSIAIKRCLHNLLNNAIKFTEQGGIDVTAQLGNDGQVVIAVADTGIGIAEANLGKVFDYYTYLSRVAEQSVASTGLGLALCRKLIEMLGGRLWVESQLGKGSVFRISLPVESSIQTTAPSAMAPEDTKEGHHESPDRR